MRHNGASKVWGRGLLKRGLVFCIKSVDLGEVLMVAGGGGVVGFTKERAFWLKVVNFFCKKTQLRCFNSFIRRLQ